MTDVSIIGTGCLIVALVVGAVIGWLIRSRVFDHVEAKRKAALRAHLDRIGDKGRATQTARALAKKAAGQ